MWWGFLAFRMVNIWRKLSGRVIQSNEMMCPDSSLTQFPCSKMGILGCLLSHPTGPTRSSQPLSGVAHRLPLPWCQHTAIRAATDPCSVGPGYKFCKGFILPSWPYRISHVSKRIRGGKWSLKTLLKRRTWRGSQKQKAQAGFRAAQVAGLQPGHSQTFALYRVWHWTHHIPSLTTPPASQHSQAHCIPGIASSQCQGD